MILASIWKRLSPIIYVRLTYQIQYTEKFGREVSIELHSVHPAKLVDYSDL